MRYVAAALLAALGGGEVSEASIKKILRYDRDIGKTILRSRTCWDLVSSQI